MADVILIYPRIGDMDAIRDRPHLPLGLLQAAAFLPGRFQVSVLDMRLTGSWKTDLARELAAKPLLVGFSVMSGRPVASALDASIFVKRHGGALVVWGGSHASLCPEQTLEHPALDAVVIGDGEQTLLEYTERLAHGRSPEGVAGLWYKDPSGRIRRNPFRPPADLNAMPPPPCHLVDVNDYVQGYGGKRVLNLETSRGCVHRCRYCYHTGKTGHHGFRCLNADKTIERLLRARGEFGVDGAYLVDDNFFLDKARGMAVVEELAAQRTPYSWQIQGVDVPSMLGFSDAELALLEKSGLMRISVGAESGSPRTLRRVGKPHTVEMLLAANRRFSRTGVRVFYSWMAGLPGETLDDVRQTIRAMFTLMNDNPNARLSPLYNFLPFPGTAIWDEVIAEHGFVPPDSLAGWGGYDWGKVNVPYLPARMKKLLTNLYLPSLCMDRKFDDYRIPAWMRLALTVYRPLARARMRHLYGGFALERTAAGLLEKLFTAGRTHRVPWTL